jgi:hypothetical protein
MSIRRSSRRGPTFLFRTPQVSAGLRHDELDLTDTTISLGADEDPYYWDPESEGTIQVDADAGSVTVRMPMISSSAAVHLTAVITAPVPG